ncbi:hypothetical protein QFZ22_002344 [Streptomyces canus]|uniref:Uncharacterized protein n=1 Tax=Streptomyces canus TaxID=58343 RepID=A0AAW8F9E9_9ACTN|nr:hypothetical protein [Streptomyces canus]MDQ0906359.1 hypothetical protein [Streptomyces canus]
MCQDLARAWTGTRIQPNETGVAAIGWAGAVIDRVTVDPAGTRRSTARITGPSIAGG